MTPAQIGVLTVPSSDVGTIAEASTLITATPGSVDSLTLAEVQTVTSSGVTPWLLEDFSTYTSTSDMLSDPRGIYSVAEDVNTSQMALDTTVGYGSSTKSMRYDFPDRTGTGGSGNTGRCSDYTIGRNITLPSHITTQMWVEWVMKTSSGFTTVAPSGWGCTTAAAYKFAFGRTDVSRFQMVPGIFGNEYTLGYPGNEEPADYAETWDPFDASWHVYRIWYGLGSGTGGTAMLVDGVNVKSFTGVSPTASYVYGLALGRNINQGPAALSSVYWGKIAVYNTDPGWGLP